MSTITSFYLLLLFGFIYADNATVSIIDLSPGVPYTAALSPLTFTDDYYFYRDYFKIYVTESALSASVNLASLSKCALSLRSQIRVGFPCQHAGLCNGGDLVDVPPQSNQTTKWDLFSPKFSVDTYLYLAVVRSYNNIASPEEGCPYTLIVNITSCPDGQMAYITPENKTACKEYISGAFGQPLSTVGHEPPFLYKLQMPASVARFDVNFVYDSLDQMTYFGGSSTRIPSYLNPYIFPEDSSFSVDSFTSSIYTGNSYNLSAFAMLEGHFYFRGDYSSLMNGTAYFQYHACPENYIGEYCEYNYTRFSSMNTTFTKSLSPSTKKEYYYIDIPTGTMTQFNITWNVYSGFGLLHLRKNGFPSENYNQDEFNVLPLEDPYTYSLYVSWQNTFPGGKFIFCVENPRNDTALEYSLEITYINDLSSTTTTSTTTAQDTTATTTGFIPETAAGIKLYACFLSFIMTVLINIF